MVEKKAILTAVKDILSGEVHYNGHGIEIKPNRIYRKNGEGYIEVNANGEWREIPYLSVLEEIEVPESCDENLESILKLIGIN